MQEGDSAGQAVCTFAAVGAWRGDGRGAGGVKSASEKNAVRTREPVYDDSI